jgi:hypothetical protein
MLIVVVVALFAAIARAENDEYEYIVTPTLEGAGVEGAMPSGKISRFLMFKMVMWLNFTRREVHRRALDGERVHAAYPRLDVAAELRRALLEEQDQPHDELLLKQIPAPMAMRVECRPPQTCEDGIEVTVRGGCPCCDRRGGRLGHMRFETTEEIRWIAPEDDYDDGGGYPQCGAKWASPNVLEFMFIISENHEVELVPPDIIDEL